MTDASDDHRDELPPDLDATSYVGPYQFPDNKRRRVPGALYAVAGLACIAGWLAADPGSILVNRGTLGVGVGLLAVGVYTIAAAYPLRVGEVDALAAAGGHVGFTVGHASAQLGWRGLRSRPTWRILLYSAEDPPAKRSLVLVDAVDGAIVGSFVEDNPEDWTDFRAVAP